MNNKAVEGPDPGSMSYEEARDELTEIVSALESGTESLERSLNLWERGEALATRCAQWLDAAQSRLDGAGKEPAETPTTPGSGEAPKEPEAKAVRTGERPTAEPMADSSPSPKETAQSGDSTPGGSSAGQPPPPPEVSKPSLRSVPSAGQRPEPPKPGTPSDPPW